MAKTILLGVISGMLFVCLCYIIFIKLLYFTRIPNSSSRFRFFTLLTYVLVCSILPWSWLFLFEYLNRSVFYLNKYQKGISVNIWIVFFIFSYYRFVYKEINDFKKKHEEEK